MKMLWLVGLLSACSGPLPAMSGETLGQVWSGSYHLGPVDWQESQWANSCGPYPERVQRAEGAFLAGVDLSLNGQGQLCDACALVTTRLGKSLVVRIITTGASKANGDMDLSPQAYDSLFQADPQATAANPRPMQWQLVKCPPASGNILVQYQTEANTDWTSLWVRNARLPLDRVEVQSARHPAYTPLSRGSDGSWTLARGFGEGPFSLRLTSGQTTLTPHFASFEPGSVVDTQGQFP